MEVKCPCCHHKFEVEVYRRTKSAKANAARRKNGLLGGGQPKAPEAKIAKIYESRTEWTGESFQEAIQRSTGFSYSRSRAFALLHKMKTQGPTPRITSGGSSSALVIAEVFRDETRPEPQMKKTRKNEVAKTA